MEHSEGINELRKPGQQEADEAPIEGRGPVPAWLIALYLAFAAWAFYYIFVIGLLPPPEWR